MVFYILVAILTFLVWRFTSKYMGPLVNKVFNLGNLKEEKLPDERRKQ